MTFRHFTLVLETANANKTIKNANSNEPPHDKTNKMASASTEDRSAWGSTQSDQSLRCPHEETLGP